VQSTCCLSQWRRIRRLAEFEYEMDGGNRGCWGIMRFREDITETAGFYNTVGFNDDGRSIISIPARHDVARRVDSSFLARLVVEHRLGEGEAMEVAAELAGGLARKAYRL